MMILFVVINHNLSVLCVSMKVHFEHYNINLHNKGTSKNCMPFNFAGFNRLTFNCKDRIILPPPSPLAQDYKMIKENKRR